MTKHRDLAYGDRLPESLLDAMEELLGTYASPNLALTLPTATSVRVVAGTGNDQVAIALSGRWRYRSTTVTVSHPGGSGGTYDVWAVGYENAFVPGNPETDNTVYDFDLRIVAHGQTPVTGTGATAIGRKIGELTWDGAVITAITSQLAGAPVVRDVPIGAMLDWPWASGSIPAWSALPYGQLLTAAGYPAMQSLADASSRPYGGSAGVNFNLPDLRGRVAVGKDDMGGSAASRITVGISGVSGATLGAVFGGEGITLTTAQLPAHNHGLTGTPSLSGSPSISDPGHTHSLSTDGGVSGGTNVLLNQQGVSGGRNDGGPAPTGHPPGTAETTGITAGVGSLAVGIGSLAVSNNGSGSVHQNTQPSIIVNKIMRVL